MKICAVVPAYNEARTIRQVVEALKDKVAEVIVIDDGSADQTAELAKAAGAKVVRHSINRGQGAALQTGIDFALSRGAEIIVTFDADGQFVAEEINRLALPILRGEAQAVLGSRFLKKDNLTPWAKKIILKIATFITRLYTGLNVSDTHNGFRAFDRTAAETIKIRQAGMAHGSEILEQIKKHKLKFVEAPVTVKYSDYSLQKGQKLSNSFRIIFDLFLSRLSR
ncbi:MAG: hypothetical protein A3H67_03780 [Candidatus Buchananbacteria bacterium RIFCSPLOWO2_02_FULL_46_11b]|uniref:Glycosyltransferase 2-like domain-containing protein n=2 Tax=Candidatus Buchananiibacteriota TaxID=1817903 RepID=A0A1G1YP17_9BACT|nr:MAG: hypothetical protein A3B15_00115 [Candidatus Buchananbacteria bacterium RIFCSPLOWO2_01_FULL_45_31]OGY57311.1 MAG: hypothetical protein A3H67_03780 [Candidatus Buchananbacteria bacterium RIFCSPLOWO2_02_FULL_46_11b]